MLNKRMSFMNTNIDNVTMDEAVQIIDEMTKLKQNSYVVTPNVDHIVKIEHDMEFKEIYDHASLILTDGKPLLWIANLYHTPIVEKVSGSDLFPKVCEMAARRGYSMFFLGAKEGVAAKAAEILEKQYKGLNIVGTYSPQLGFEKDKAQVDSIIKMINKANPDILILALGCPKQEKFYYRNRESLHVPMALAIGASLDFVAGNVKRSPKWMSDCGLEWLYRITQDPKRMIKRYLGDDLVIFKLFWKYRKGKNENTN